MDKKDYILKIRNLSAGYNGSSVLENLNLDVEQGELLAIIGQNGCGKSTLLKTIFRLTPVNSGIIIFKGKNIMNMDSDFLIDTGISYFMQRGLIFPNLTVKEHLDLAMRNNTNNNLEEIVNYFPEIKEYFKKKAGNLSGGQRQNLSLSMLLAQQTTFWLLDEPIAGLDPERARITSDFIGKMNEEKQISIMLVEHNYDAAFKLAHKVCVIKDGKAGEKFTPDVFKQNDFPDNYVYL
jgi:ABC-type branched-subunit amino acid transport system ATPase component